MEETKEPKVLDSGERYKNEFGGQRDVSTGKPNFKYVPHRIINLVYQRAKENSPSLGDEHISEVCQKILLDEKYRHPDCLDVMYAMLNVIGRDNQLHDTTIINRTYFGLEKFALFMEKCAEKYDFGNWKLLTTKEDLQRFKESLLRHSVEALFELKNEFHREAVIFNAMCLFLNEFKE